MSIKFDMSRWNAKSANVKAALAEAVKKSVDFGIQSVHEEAAKNLTGPHYQIGERGLMTGQMPIPRITGNLARSLKQRRMKPELGAVYADSGTANYAAYVHDGTKYVKPRRFLGDAVKMKKEAILRRFSNNCKLAIRRAGQ